MKNRVAVLLILVAAIAIYAWSATGKIRFTSAMKDSADKTKDVILERYHSGTVIQTAIISNRTFTSWLDQLPKGLGSLPHTHSKCWIPHHRIKFDEATDNKVEICFTCNEIWTEAAGRRKIPEDWRQPLRALFAASDIPDSAPDWREASQFLDAVVEETLLGDGAELIPLRQVPASDIDDSVELVGATGLPLGKRFTIEAKIVLEKRKHHKDTDRKLIVIRTLNGRVLGDHLKLELWEGDNMPEDVWLTLDAYEDAAYSMVDILPYQVDPTAEGLLVQRLSTGVNVLGPAVNSSGTQQGEARTGPPATHPESKPEGDDKPQPESEGSSR